MKYPHRMGTVALALAMAACSSPPPADPKPPFLRVNPDGTCDVTTHKANGSEEVVQLHEPTCKVTSLGIGLDIQASGDGKCGPISCTKYTCNSTSALTQGSCPVPTYEWGQTWTIIEH